MSENRKASHLSLAVSADDYPYPLSVEILFDPKNNITDSVFKNVPDYKIQKKILRPVELARSIHGAMRTVGVTEYSVDPQIGFLRAHFKTEMDRFIAAASVQPGIPCYAPVLNFSQQDAPETIEEAADRMHSIFNVAGGHKMKFSPSQEERAVRAYAPTGIDFLHFMADFRRTDDKLICRYR